VDALYAFRPDLSGDLPLSTSQSIAGHRLRGGANRKVSFAAAAPEDRLVLHCEGRAVMFR
jgi:hypothetical protein